jgi:hypothetical protein
MELKKKDDGCWHVGYQTDHGYKWKNTKATSREEADAIVATAKIAEIELLAKSSSLTSEVLSSIMTGRKVVVSQVLAEWVEWRKINKSANTVQAQA